MVGAPVSREVRGLGQSALQPLHQGGRAAPSGLAGVVVEEAVQSEVVGDHEQRGLRRVPGPAAAPAQTVVEGAEQAEVPGQEEPPVRIDGLPVARELRMVQGQIPVVRTPVRHAFVCIFRGPAPPEVPRQVVHEEGQSRHVTVADN